MDMQQLLTYTNELEIENAELKKHIFNIQQQLQETNETKQIYSAKNQQLDNHIKMCQNQIIKRETRELQILKECQDLQKDAALYIQQIDTLKNQLISIRQDNDNLLKQVSRKGSGIPPKAQSIKIKSEESQKQLPQEARDRECSNCKLLVEQNRELYHEFQKQRGIIWQLQKDIKCLVFTLSPIER